MNTLLNQFYVMRSLLRRPDATRDEITAFQNKQLRRLITHAYENVPYYRRLFDRNGLKPSDIQSISDLPTIPITSKRDLQSLPVREIISRDVNPEHLIVHITSGSSGEPLTIRRTQLENYLFGLFRLRNAMRVGLRMRDIQANIDLIRPGHPAVSDSLSRYSDLWVFFARWILIASYLRKRSYVDCGIYALMF